MDSSVPNATVMSTETLIMSLLGQVQCLENERDNARLLAARMRERLEHIIYNNNLKTSESAKDHKTGLNNNHRLAKMVKQVSSGALHDIQQIIANEENRYQKLKELVSEREAEHNTGNLRGQLSVCKQHYEKLLEEAERDKVELRKKLKEHQDMLLDRDIKIQELERKLQNTGNQV